MTEQQAHSLTQVVNTTLGEMGTNVHTTIDHLLIPRNQLCHTYNVKRKLDWVNSEMPPYPLTSNCQTKQYFQNH